MLYGKSCDWRWYRKSRVPSSGCCSDVMSQDKSWMAATVVSGCVVWVLHVQSKPLLPSLVSRPDVMFLSFKTVWYFCYLPHWMMIIFVVLDLKQSAWLGPVIGAGGVVSWSFREICWSAHSFALITHHLSYWESRFLLPVAKAQDDGLIFKTLLISLFYTIVL